MADSVFRLMASEEARRSLELARPPPAFSVTSHHSVKSPGRLY